MFRQVAAGALALVMLVAPAVARAEPDAVLLGKIDGIFNDWRLDSHVPGLVYGIVQDGKLVVVRGQGVQDTVSGRAVDPDSRFRIASMSKAFTALAILKLRDEGKLSLDAPAELYVPEMKGWTYPTRDTRRIRVRDLLNHVAGFVTDDPWGDRQQPLSEAEFTRMLKAGVPFSRSGGLAMEYSNFGYATLGRIVTNVSGKPYQQYIRETFMIPLGMASTGYDIARSPPERRAIGYRWQDDAWLREPDMGDGVFGAMGGVETTANDYAKWVAFLLSAWPPRDAADVGPVARPTVREIAEGSNFPQGAMRATAIGGAPCRAAVTYGMGWRVSDDCDLGRTLSHGGGYPGYGSHVLLLPERGIGLFVFTNRTYSGPSVPAWKAALALLAAGEAPDRAVTVSERVTAGYGLARTIFAQGTVAGQGDGLAMNFLLDRDEPHWAKELARVKAEVGACAADEPVSARTAMQGSFVWTCEHGRVGGGFLLAPTPQVRLQSLSFEVLKP
ncbi:serine hydrolase domain-containing protein [Caulobacter sp. NIBR1757]|uniref:serine hydrolase domain-containing protein n=1 Tax=Caulobacter sp. NIBR1757 TaxID=3016000 RepID=UPI0022F0B719|nr:serine hydrolase domain-containing protein [Caulobacter sp. NIBR1757]WGM39916.1 Putative D-alanyl-D-alanine carboxypeptidase [Caulobacter sp. NIBR1757]